MPNLFQVLGISPDLLLCLDDGQLKEFIQQRYRSLSALGHPNSPSRSKSVAVHWNYIQAAYDDAEIDAIFSDDKDEWAEKSSSQSPFARLQHEHIRNASNDMLRLYRSTKDSRQGAEFIEQLWQGLDIDEAQELSTLEQTMTKYLCERTLSGVFSDEDLYAGDRPLHPPYSLILNDDLPLIVLDAIEKQKRPGGEKYIPGLELLNEDSAWVELYITAQGAQMRPLKYGGVKAKKWLALAESEHRFKQPKNPFRWCSLKPIGTLYMPSLRTGEIELEPKSEWFRRLIKRYPDGQDMKAAVEGFSWEQIAKVVPYLSPDLVASYPIVAIDDSEEEPRFKVFSSLQWLQHFPEP